MERDLFGVFLVETRYGRIGTQGRTLAKSFDDESQARDFIAKCLKKRQSAPRRIGTEYAEVHLAGPSNPSRVGG